MSSYNPYYIPSLKDMETQAANEARAQVNASVATLPTDKGITDQFTKTGRDLRGFDQSYIDFLQRQRATSLVDTAPPSYTPFQGTAGGATSGATDLEAKNAGAASAMLGIGFSNQREALQNAAAGLLEANQGRNRRSLHDAITTAAAARAAEQTKFEPLRQDILHGKKSDALNAYNSYLANQLNAANAGATQSYNQGKLDIGQQNANTSQQNANTAAAKAAAAAADGGSKATQTARTKALDNTYKYLDNMVVKTEDSKRTDVVATRWQASEVSGFPPTTKNVGPVIELPPGTTASAAQAILKKTYPNLSGVVHVDDKTKDVVVQKHHSYTWLHETAVRKLVGSGFSQTRAEKLVKAYLKALGIKPDNISTATSSGSR